MAIWVRSTIDPSVASMLIPATPTPTPGGGGSLSSPAASPPPPAAAATPPLGRSHSPAEAEAEAEAEAGPLGGADWRPTPPDWLAAEEAFRWALLALDGVRVRGGAAASSVLHLGHRNSPSGT